MSCLDVREVLSLTSSWPPSLQYKFRVDGEWRYDPLAPLARDEEGNLNNTLELLDPHPDYDLPADFDAPLSPSERCTAASHVLTDLPDLIFASSRTFLRLSDHKI